MDDFTYVHTMYITQTFCDTLSLMQLGLVEVMVVVGLVVVEEEEGLAMLFVYLHYHIT